MALPLPIGWSQKEFDDWFAGLAAEARDKQAETARVRSEPELQANVNEWLATGTTVSPLPRAWSSKEFSDWMAGLQAEGAQAYRQYILARTPTDIIANVIEAMAAPPPPWTPADLGAALLAWWDAERADLITQAGGLVSSWRDIVGAYDVTATTTARPTYGAVSFNGRPGVTFDGVANCLTMTAPLGWVPIGAAGSEDWYGFDQTALAADATLRCLGTWGGGSNNNARNTNRFVVTGTNRATMAVGTGASSTGHTNSLVNFSGRQVVRSVVTPTTEFVEVGGVADTPTATVAATIASRLRMGANSLSSAGQFIQGTMNARLITGPLTVQQADSLRSWLMARL